MLKVAFLVVSASAVEASKMASTFDKGNTGKVKTDDFTK